MAMVCCGCEIPAALVARVTTAPAWWAEEGAGLGEEPDAAEDAPGGIMTVLAKTGRTA